MQKAVRHYSLTLFSNVVYRSPVDTGRFRGNWQCSIGVPITSVLDSKDKSGSETLAKVRAVVETMEVGQTIYLTNNLSYAIPLEYGSSAQAPSGVVRISIMTVNSMFGGAR